MKINFKTNFKTNKMFGEKKDSDLFLETNNWFKREENDWRHYFWFDFKIDFKWNEMRAETEAKLLFFPK